jgi:anti-sigma-K factor RskA
VAANRQVPAAAAARQQRATSGGSAFSSRHQPRKEREAIDFVTEELLLGLLESGDVRTFNTIIGTLQDLKNIVGRVSPDQEKCLRLPLVLLEAAVNEQEVIEGNSKLNKPD